MARTDDENKNVNNLNFWAKMANFGSFWQKWAKRDFFQKSVCNIFLRLQALINCKDSEKN